MYYAQYPPPKALPSPGGGEGHALWAFVLSSLLGRNGNVYVAASSFTGPAPIPNVELREGTRQGGEN